MTARPDSAQSTSQIAAWLPQYMQAFYVLAVERERRAKETR